MHTYFKDHSLISTSLAKAGEITAINEHMLRASELISKPKESTKVSKRFTDQLET